MNSHQNTTAMVDGASPVETRDVDDAIDILVKATSINRIVGAGMVRLAVNDDERDGMMFIIDYVDDLLKDVKSILYANIRQGNVQ